PVPGAGYEPGVHRRQALVAGPGQQHRQARLLDAAGQDPAAEPDVLQVEAVAGPVAEDRADQAVLAETVAAAGHQEQVLRPAGRTAGRLVRLRAQPGEVELVGALGELDESRQLVTARR